MTPNRLTQSEPKDDSKQKVKNESSSPTRPLAQHLVFVSQRFSCCFFFYVLSLLLVLIPGIFLCHFQVLSLSLLCSFCPCFKIMCLSPGLCVTSCFILVGHWSLCSVSSFASLQVFPIVLLPVCILPHFPFVPCCDINTDFFSLPLRAPSAVVVVQSASLPPHQ